jgi:hypothetical protein
MSNPLNMMMADSKQLVEGEPDLSPLLGDWVNSNPETDYISKITVARQNGRLVVRVFGAHSPEPIDWGKTEATAYVTGGSLDGVGFHARYAFGEIETYLAANQKLGILVIQSYTSFKDQSRRMNHFAREFFHL